VFFIKFILDLKQILISNINFSIIALIVFARLLTYISSLFLKLSKILLNNINTSFLIIFCIKFCIKFLYLFCSSFFFL